MTSLEILKAARELISVPERWTQGVYARDASGVCTAAKDLKATCWCSLGAIFHVAKPGFNRQTARTHLAKEVGTLIHIFNDSHIHADVLAAFDRAIAAAEASK